MDHARRTGKGSGRSPSKMSTFHTTASCQKVVKEAIGYIEVQSDLSNSLLKEVLSGHKIHGVPSSPTALWADVALTLAHHLATRAKQTRKGFGLNVSGMILKSPLSLTSSKQIYRASGHLDLDSQSVWVEIFSINEFGKVLTHHAECIVKFEDLYVWREDWEQGDDVVKAKVNFLRAPASSDDVNVVSSGPVYKLFRHSLEYSEQYQGVESVAYEDDIDDEASASLRFWDYSSDDFFLSPYNIDILCQGIGFLAHANIDLDLKANDFVNHGWDSLRVSKPLLEGRSYQSLVRMRETRSGVLRGDIYLLEGEHIMAAVRGVRYQNVARHLEDVNKPNVLAASKSVPNTLEESSKAMSALSIIAKEMGIRLAEMSLDDAFDTIGLDSLLSLQITNCLRDELGLEINSSLFATCPTIKELVAYIDGSDTNVERPQASSTSCGGSSTSPSSSSHYCTSSTASPNASDNGSVPSTPPSSVASSVNGDDAKETKTLVPVNVQIRALIAEEAGVEACDVDGSTTLAELGLDSLLAVTLSSRLREYLSRKDITPAIFANEALTCDEIVTALRVR